MTCLAKKTIAVDTLWTVGQYSITRAPDPTIIEDTAGVVAYSITDGSGTEIIGAALPWNATYAPVAGITGAYVLFDVDTSTLTRGNSYWLSYTLDGDIIPFSEDPANPSRIRIKAV